MSEPNIKGTVELTNFGPLLGTNSLEVKPKLGIFARNGEGKTFLTRAFLMLAPAGKLPWVTRVDRSRLVSWGQGEATVSASLRLHEGGKNRERGSHAVTLDSEGELHTTSTTSQGPLFHVFSADYVDYNVRENGYRPSSGVDGHIVVSLGDEEEDINAFKASEETLAADLSSLKRDFTKSVTDLRESLAEYDKVNRNLQAWKDIDDELVAGATRLVHIDRLLEVRDALVTLGGDVPEPSVFLPTPPLARDIQDDQIGRLLKRPAMGGDLDEQFLAKMAENGRHTFVEMGRQLTSDEDRCPYCEQELRDDRAKALIASYRAYLLSDVAEVRSDVEAQIKRVESLHGKILLWLKETWAALHEIAAAAESIADSKVSLPPPRLTAATVNRLAAELTALLEEKRKSPEEVQPVPSVLQLKLAAASRLMHKWNALANAELDRLKKVRLGRGKRIRDLRTELCRLAVEDLAAREATNLDEIQKKDVELTKLRARIVELEEKSRVGRRDQYLSTLKACLKTLFGDQISVDDSGAGMVLKARAGTRSLDEGVQYMLSDGQRNGIAFCHYVASVHELVDSVEDYARIVLVIDDPMTSLDHHNIYGVLSMIRDTASYLRPDPKANPGTVPAQFSPRCRIVLTHSHSLFNALMANKIITSWYTIRDGALSREKPKIMFPYDEHLAHIVDVARGSVDATYHTPNSCRHVLETIGRFLYPAEDKPFEKMINDLDATASPAKSMLHDLSHGRFRFEETDPAQVIETCKTIESYMSEKYPGQLAHLAASPETAGGEA